MKRHFLKKYIFTVLFMVVMFVYSGINLFHEAPAIQKTLQTFDWGQLKQSIQALESTINDNVYQKYAFLEEYGFVQQVLGTDVENGFAFVKSKEGKVLYDDAYEEARYLEEDMECIGKIFDMAEEAGAKGFVLLAPDKCVEGEVSFREGIPYADKNDVLDRVKDSLQEQKIPCVDTRDYYAKIKEWSNGDIFYDTDHHWNTKTAFYMYTVVLDELQKTWEESLDPDGKFTNLDYYNMYHYEDCFLGSMGRETGIMYSGLDDIDVIYPKYETFFVRTYKSTMEGEDRVAQGDFMTSLMNPYNLTNQDLIYNNDKYSIYLDSVNAQDSIVNLRNEEGPKVLVIRDSFFAAIGAFLANSCSELDLIWSMRYTGDVEKMIKEGEYDYVIVELGADNLNDSDLFQFVK